MLIRMIFWISVVVMFLPTDLNSQLDTNANNEPVPGALDVAQSVFYDLREFCDRNEEACSAMTRFGRAFGERLQAHTLSLGEYLASLDSNPQSDPIKTGSIAPQQK